MNDFDNLLDMRFKRIDQKRKRFEFDRKPGSFMVPTLSNHNTFLINTKNESNSFSNNKIMLNSPSEVSNLTPVKAGGLRNSVGVERGGSVLTVGDTRTSQPSLKDGSDGEGAVGYEAAQKNKLRR